MYNLPSFCCICFNNKEELKNINSKECVESQILNKLNFCSFETDWMIPDLPIYICRKCAHILEIAVDFKNMCLKSNRLLKGYVNQLKGTSSTDNNIRNELMMMFNNPPVPTPEAEPAPGPSNKIKSEAQKSDTVMNFCDIKSEFSELANCANPVESFPHNEFTFEMKSGQHQCTLCHKCFSRESVLTRHMLIHSGQRPHHCNICNKNFTHKFNLKQHLLIHTGHKNHHCTVCDKGFIKKSDLDRHMLTHFGERIHHCSLCSKSFVRKENLNQHILTHTGQKPHHCNQCSKSFLRKSDLNRHTLLCISKRS